MSPLSIGLESPDFLLRPCLREWKATRGTIFFIRRIELSPFVIYPPLPLSYLTPGLPGSLWDFPFVGDVIPTHAFKFLFNGFVFLFFCLMRVQKSCSVSRSFDLACCFVLNFKKWNQLAAMSRCVDRHGQVFGLST